MIGMVLVTHGHLATEFRAALEHVVGPQKQIVSISIGPEDDMERRRSDIIEAIKQGRQRRWRGAAHRHVRRHAVQSGDIGHEWRKGRGSRGSQSAHADQAGFRPRLRSRWSRPCCRRRTPGANMFTSPAKFSTRNERSRDRRRNKLRPKTLVAGARRSSIEEGAARPRDGQIRAMLRKIRRRHHGLQRWTRRSAAARSWAF